MAADPRASIAHVTAGGQRGTGFAIGRTRVLTCLHVVADRKASPPTPHGAIAVRFAGHPPIVAELIDHDAVTDWALLEVEVPKGIDPLVLRPASPDTSPKFWTWGFADLNSVDGKTFEGRVQNFNGTFAQKAPALELYSEQAKNVPVHGLSGAPCLADDQVIGILRVSLDDQERSLGTLYATPIAECLKARDLREVFVNPYQGLKPFDEERSEYFYGRGKDVARLLNRLRTSGRLLTVLGASGSGKSSLVLAGLVPALRGGALSENRRFHVVPMRPGARPVHELALRLNKHAEHARSAVEDLRARLAKGGEVLSDVLDEELVERGDDWSALLVVDQLEEIFTQGAGAGEREKFLELLVSATRIPHGRTHVVTTLRADFLGPLRESQFEPDLREAAVLVGPVSGAALEEVVRGPAARVGLSFEPKLVEQLLKDARGNLPLLQMALERLWRERQVNQLTWRGYGGMGGVPGAIARRADEVFDQLGERKAMVERLFLLLVNPGDGTAPDTRRTATHQELGAVDAGYRTTLAPFINERLLVSKEEGIEIAHEAIIADWARLRGWIDGHRIRRLAQESLAREAAAWKRGNHAPDLLLGESKLRVMLDQLGDSLAELDPERLRFLARSIAEEPRELSAWVHRIPVAALIALLDELGASDQATLVLAAAGPQLAGPLQAADRLMATVEAAPGSPAADSAAAALDQLQLTGELVRRAEETPRKALDSALSHLRNLPGSGAKLFAGLKGPLRKRVRSGAALRLIYDERIYFLTVVAATLIIGQMIVQLLPALDVLIGAERAGIPIGPFSLVILCAVGGYVMRRHELDQQRLGTRATLFISLFAFALSDGLWALKSGLEAWGKRLFDVEGPGQNPVTATLFPWFSALGFVALAWFFRGQRAPAPSGKRILVVALLGSFINAVINRYGWTLLEGLSPFHQLVLQGDYQSFIVEISYGVLLIGSVLLTFREIQRRFRAAGAESGTSYIKRGHLLLLGSAAMLTVLVAKTSTWLEQRYASGDTRAATASRLYGRGRTEQALRIWSELCDRGNDSSCTELARRQEERSDFGAALAAHEKLCDRGVQRGCADGARAAEAHHDNEAMRRLRGKACDAGDPVSCDLAAALAPHGSDAALELRARAVDLSKKEGNILQLQTLEGDLQRALQKNPSAVALQIAETVCKRSARSCWLLAQALAASPLPDGARIDALLVRACDGGYLVACLERSPGPLPPAQRAALDTQLVELVLQDDSAARARATPAVLREVAERQWRDNRLSHAIDTLQLACERGDDSDCVAWGQRIRKQQQLSEARTRVPDDLVRQYDAGSGVTLVRLVSQGKFGELFRGPMGYSFADRRYGWLPDIRLGEEGLLVGKRMDPTSSAGWDAVEGTPWTALRPSLSAAPRSEALPLTAPATYLLHSHTDQSDVLVLLHVERILEDGSVVIAWKSLKP